MQKPLRLSVLLRAGVVTAFEALDVRRRSSSATIAHHLPVEGKRVKPATGRIGKAPALRNLVTQLDLAPFRI